MALSLKNLPVTVQLTHTVTKVRLISRQRESDLKKKKKKLFKNDYFKITLQERSRVYR